MSMILAEAEEGRPRASRQWFGRTNTIEYHDFFARQFAIFSASKGDDFDGIVRQGDVCPGGMNIVAASLKHWHQALRKGEYNGIDGIDSVKRAVVAAGGTMDALERRVELSELPDFFQKYKEMKGDSFDGTVRAGDDFPGFESCEFLYRRVERIISGGCDGEDGIVQVKAAAREMGYLITDEGFLGMLQKYVDAEGRSGRIKKNATIVGVNSGKMFVYVKKIRSGSDADLKERVDEILGPHPNDREALDALSETLRGRIHSIAGKMGLLSPGVSEEWDIRSDLFSDLVQRCIERFGTMSYPFFACGNLIPSLAPELFQVDGRPEDVLVCLLELAEGWTPSTRPDSEEAAGVVTDLLMVLSYAVSKSSYKLPDNRVDAIVDSWLEGVTAHAAKVREEYDIKDGEHCSKFLAHTDGAPHKEMRDAQFDGDTCIMIGTMAKFMRRAEANLIMSKARRSAKATIFAVYHISEKVTGENVDVWGIAGGRGKKRLDQRREMKRTFDYDKSCVLCPIPMQFYDLDNANDAESLAQRRSKEVGGFLYKPKAIFPNESDRPDYLRPLPVTLQKRERARLKKETEDAEAKFQKEKAEHELKMQTEREAHERKMREEKGELEGLYKRRQELVLRQLTKSDQARNDAEAERDKLRSERDELQSEVLRLRGAKEDYDSATSLLKAMPNAFTSTLPFSSTSSSSSGPLSTMVSNVANNFSDIHRHVDGIQKFRSEVEEANSANEKVTRENGKLKRRNKYYQKRGDHYKGECTKMMEKLEAAHSAYNRVKDREEQRFRDEELASESQGDGDDSKAAGGGISIGGISSDAYDGYSSPTPSDMSISDSEDDDSSDDSASTAVEPVGLPNREISQPSAITTISPVPTSSGAKQGAALTTGAVAAKAETQPQREGSSIASPQQRKKRKQAKSADLADWFEAS